jgi:predicted nucleotidyltransferase
MSCIGKSDNTLVKLVPSDPLGGRSKEDFLKALVAILHGRISEAYLFGSIASDQFGPQSDVDLILIADSGRPFVERFKDFTDVLALAPRIDLLIYTPAEFHKIRSENPVGFWKTTLAQLERVL